MNSNMVMNILLKTRTIVCISVSGTGTVKTLVGKRKLKGAIASGGRAHT
jgi:hypothetical protein